MPLTFVLEGMDLFDLGDRRSETPHPESKVSFSEKRTRFEPLVDQLPENDKTKGINETKIPELEKYAKITFLVCLWHLLKCLQCAQKGQTKVA